MRKRVLAGGDKIVNALSSGTTFRGLECIMEGAHRTPGPSYNGSVEFHAIASIQAVEDALDINILKNAVLIRKLRPLPNLYRIM